MFETARADAPPNRERHLEHWARPALLASVAAPQEVRPLRLGEVGWARRRSGARKYLSSTLPDRNGTLRHE